MDVGARVRSRGGRMTLQRQLVLDALGRARHHTTAEEITDYVRSRYPRVDASTVYRNLEALEELGEATHTHIDGRVTRWHRAGVERHGHLVCRVCGREEKVEISDLEPLERKLRTEHGFRADLAHSAILGLCSRCGA